MKRTLSILITALLLTSLGREVFAQNLTKPPKNDPVGIGLLFINKMVDLPLYNSQDSSAVFDTIKIRSITEGKKKGSFAIQSGKLKEKFDPYGLSPGSSYEEGQYLVNSGLGPTAARLVFKVVKHHDNNYEVVISEKDHSTAIINISKDDSQNRFETWEHYLKRLASIIPLKGRLPIFDYPDGKRLNLADRDPSRLTVDSVKGYWAHVRSDDKILGWVKWRGKNKVLVEFVEQFLE